MQIAICEHLINKSNRKYYAVTNVNNAIYSVQKKTN